MKNKFIKLRNKGFTLIELMISVAIVAVISVSALPIYADKIIKEQVKEAYNFTETIKPLIKDFYFNNNKRFPYDNQELGIENIQGQYVKSIVVEDGVIKATLGNAVNKKLTDEQIILTPYPMTPTYLNWTCEFVGPKQYAPYVCSENFNKELGYTLTEKEEVPAEEPAPAPEEPPFITPIE